MARVGFLKVMPNVLKLEGLSSEKQSMKIMLLQQALGLVSLFTNDGKSDSYSHTVRHP